MSSGVSVRFERINRAHCNEHRKPILHERNSLFFSQPRISRKICYNIHLIFSKKNIFSPFDLLAFPFFSLPRKPDVAQKLFPRRHPPTRSSIFRNRGNVRAQRVLQKSLPDINNILGVLEQLCFSIHQFMKNRFDSTSFYFLIHIFL